MQGILVRFGTDNMRILPDTSIRLHPSAMPLNGSDDRHTGAPTRRGEKERLTAHNRREQLLQTAAVQFAKSGFHATTTNVLAKAAGISEPVLYAHFPDKEYLFREVVKRDTERRIRALRLRISSIPPATPDQFIEQIVESTISVCLSVHGGAVLTNWALLELPDFAIDVHREEIGTVAAMWQEQLLARFPNGGCRPVLSEHTISCIEACYSYALWLGALRHTPATASPLVKQFAARVAEAGCALIHAATRRGQGASSGS